MCKRYRTQKPKYNLDKALLQCILYCIFNFLIFYSAASMAQNYTTYIQSCLFLWIAWIACRMQDAWTNTSKYFRERYIRMRVWQLSNSAIVRNPPLHTLLCAYLDPSKYAEDTSQVRCVPVDLTAIMQEYYNIDTLQSCFSLQKWLNRFNIQCKFINVIYRAHSDIFVARIDLDNDIETRTGSECSNLSIDALRGIAIHRCDAPIIDK